MSKTSPKSAVSAASKRKPAASSQKPSLKSLKTRPKHVAKQQSVPGAEATLPKRQQLLALLQAPSGTTIDAMTQLTGWQPHTVRGVISGVLRKKLGLNVVCERTEQGNRYKIAAGT